MNINFSIDDKHTLNFVHDYTIELTINAKCIDHLRTAVQVLLLMKLMKLMWESAGFMFLCNQYLFVALAFVTTLLKTTCQVRPHCFAPQFGNHILFIDRVHICMRVLCACQRDTVSRCRSKGLRDLSDLGPPPQLLWTKKCTPS